MKANFFFAKLKAKQSFYISTIKIQVSSTILSFLPNQTAIFPTQTILILFLSSMRRNYRMSPRPDKQFIHTYHINEVPLPPYNPLQDPHLRHFFSNQKVNRHIQGMGFLYQPRREYQYGNRRTKNAYKFHRDNSFEIPLTHQLNKSQVARSFMFNSQRDLAQSEDYRSSSPLSPVFKKRSESDYFNNRINAKIPSLSEIISQRPATQSQRRRLGVSNQGKGNVRIFKRQSLSSNKIQNRKNPENDG